MQTSSTYGSTHSLYDDATQKPTEEHARLSCSPLQLNDTDNEALSPQDLGPHDKDSFGRSAHHSTLHGVHPLNSPPTSPESIAGTPQPVVPLSNPPAAHMSPKVHPISKTLPPLPTFETSCVTSAKGMR